jgi:hypothetical protein
MSVGAALREHARELAPDVLTLRHRLHQRPEIGLQVPRTQEILLEALDGFGLELTRRQLRRPSRASCRPSPGSCTVRGATLADHPAAAPSDHGLRATFDDAALPTGPVLHAEPALRSPDLLAGPDTIPHAGRTWATPAD